MFRFTIRDVLWLTLVSGMARGWWLLWQSIPRSARALGTVSVNGKPLANGCVYFHSADGQIVGATVTNGQYLIQSVPAGKFVTTISGDGVPAKYGNASSSVLTVEFRDGSNQIEFDLRSP